jgi:predicted DNA repair protein MutK
MNLQSTAGVVVDETWFSERFMKKLTRDRVVPIISARVS